MQAGVQRNDTFNLLICNVPRNALINTSPSLKCVESNIVSTTKQPIGIWLFLFVTKMHVVLTDILNL